MLNESDIHSAVCVKSNQEEADSKVILHCLDALNDLEAAIIIHSPSADTDIMVLSVSLLPSNED